LMDAQASDCLGSNPNRLRANSQVTALSAVGQFDCNGPPLRLDRRFADARSHAIFEA
jgi:hypothetical protein